MYVKLCSGSPGGWKVYAGRASTHGPQVRCCCSIVRDVHICGCCADCRAVEGACYEGEWLENKMHGKGVYIDTDKVRWKGQYHNGKFFNGKSFVMLR